MTTKTLSNTPDTLWLSVNPSFKRLEQQLLVYLNARKTVSHWGYFQSPDEPSELEVALTLLHDYMKLRDRPVHLIGHGTGGLVGLLYARKYPQRVRSLTLLSVGVNPAVDWKIHYYTQLDLLPCSRNQILTQMVHSLFGHQCEHCLSGLLKLLEEDLVGSLSVHSLVRRFSLFPGSVPIPLMACGGQEDPIVDPLQLQGWQPWLGESDRIWLCPEGRHFFHATHPQSTAAAILNFWNDIDASVDVALTSSER
ncbi:alpha/beta hydrolase [Oscillatoria sp. CS-180]|uniref:alpha/beta fold hydrolase n=1 Tax=Oscillatoria sp. CS-180 TaxID=3021720 RepID=UPI002330979B|nr:alpha/beta hydrolase [Oscillatoria sp. CS-180]MDB9524994.1 alpha/beta hydrolase [Oscillatoria sp. CS-180]